MGARRPGAERAPILMTTGFSRLSGSSVTAAHTFTRCKIFHPARRFPVHAEQTPCGAASAVPHRSALNPHTAVRNRSDILPVVFTRDKGFDQGALWW